MSKSISTPHLDQSGLSLSAAPGVADEESPSSPAATAPRPRFISRGFSVNAAPAPAPAAAGARKFNQPQRGLMEKFLASRGRMNSQLAFVSSAPMSHQSPLPAAGSFTAGSPLTAHGDPSGASSAASPKNVRLVHAAAPVAVDGAALASPPPLARASVAALANVQSAEVSTSLFIIWTFFSVLSLI